MIKSSIGGFLSLDKIFLGNKEQHDPFGKGASPYNTGSLIRSSLLMQCIVACIEDSHKVPLTTDIQKGMHVCQGTITQCIVGAAIPSRLHCQQLLMSIFTTSFLQYMKYNHLLSTVVMLSHITTTPYCSNCK